MRRFLAPMLPLLFLCIFVAPALAAVRSLTVGMSGSDVTTIQQELIARGYLTGSATGYFGQLTLASLEKFQCDQKIICASDTISGYGIAGPRTQAALAQASAPAQPSSVGASITPAATGKFEFSGWLPDWRASSSTLDVTPHLNQLTSVMPFGFHITDGGQIIDSSNIAGGPWPAFIAAAKAKDVRVVPTLEWGNGADEQAILSDATARVALEDAVANMVKQNNFDGIDIDFEAKQSDTINFFSTFLKGLYQRMGKSWVYCTIEARMPLNDRYSPGTIPPADATDYANDYTQINKYCDRVEIMAYDQGTVDVRLGAARSAPYAPVADPGWVSDIINLAAQTISRNKIIIGIPTYGYEYSVTPLAGSNQYDRLWAFNPAYATNIATQLGITPKRTSSDEIGFIYNPNSLNAVAPQGSDSTQTQQMQTSSTTVAQNLGSQVDTSQPYNYMTWSDAQAMQDKINLAHQLGVRGVAFFSLGGAEDQGLWSVLK